ncbi:MAG: hypothetical protein Q9228_002132 [Teloschistes exilis]
MASAVLQRVASASVTIDTQLVSSIGKGVLVFAAVAPDDTPKEVESMAAKVLKLKMWPDEAGGTFTLLASTKKTKPDFHGAAGGEQARDLYDRFVAKVQELYEPERVKNGVFAAMMQGTDVKASIEKPANWRKTVNLQNDGPVTLEIQTNPPKEQEKGGGEEEVKVQKKSKFELPQELLD